jgi:hypothetical protein
VAPAVRGHSDDDNRRDRKYGDPGTHLRGPGIDAGGRVGVDLAAWRLSVSGEDPTNADVVGGALTAGKVAVPWAIFRQTEASPAKDQVFSRSFAAGAWTTRGSGTVGGSSSAAPTFPASLNFDQTQDGEAPAIDFAGAGRTVPWATWYENTVGTGFANNNVFASRFDNTGDANQGKWIFAGQNRGTGGTNPVLVPSLNIHTNQSAENPSVAGGSAVDPTKPGPWVTWQETLQQATPTSGPDQIFVERSEGPGLTNCDTVTPAGVIVGTDVPAIGGFCWQQTGIPRVGPTAADPSLNVDPTRNGIEPDIAFTGANDAVPWVVWYETGPSTTAGLHANELVFAAKAISDGVAANGGFHWVAVGSQLSETLDTTDTCAASAANEGQCSLNNDANADAEDPRVAAGTMNPANPTVPWVAWDETVAGHKQVFVSRLVGGTHFQPANGGAPISTGTGDSTRPDITFSGNTPYVTWREDVGGGVVRAFVGHFVNPASPTRRVRCSADPDRPGHRAGADLVVVHREPVQRRRCSLPGRGDRNPVLPVHQRDEPGEPVRRCLPAVNPGDRCGNRDERIRGDDQRFGQPGGSAGQRLLPVRHGDLLRICDRRPAARARQQLGHVHRRAVGPAGRHSDPLPRRRGDRFRHARRSGPDDHHRSASEAHSEVGQRIARARDREEDDGHRCGVLSRSHQLPGVVAPHGARDAAGPSDRCRQRRQDEEAQAHAPARRRGQ